MKNEVIYSLCLIFLLLSCKENKTPPEKDSIKDMTLTSDFRVEIVKNKFGTINVYDESKNAVIYQLDFGDGAIISDSAKNRVMFLDSFLLGSHEYQENKIFDIKLVTKDTHGNQIQKQLKVPIVNIPPKLKADFSFEVLDSGTVKLKNLSINSSGNPYWTVPYFYFYTNNEYATNTINPVFRFEKNGNYHIGMSATNSFHQYDSKSIIVKISNAFEVQPASFNGVFFGVIYNKTNIFSKEFNNDKWPISNNTEWLYSYHHQGDFLGCGSVPRSTLGNESQKHIMIFNFNNINAQSNEQQYELYKYIFTLGKKVIGKCSQKDVWNILLNDGTLKESLALHEAQNPELEIIEVQEVTQPKLFPEMYDKAFWVTFKIKADFGNGNNIDGTLKVRYLIY